MDLNGLRFVCEGGCSLTTHSSDFPVYAAAPELLEVCISFVREFNMTFSEDYEGTTLHDIAKQAAAAIAKATA